MSAPTQKTMTEFGSGIGVTVNFVTGPVVLAKSAVALPTPPKVDARDVVSTAKGASNAAVVSPLKLRTSSSRSSGLGAVLGVAVEAP